ncbi:hypothetical protein EW145_g4424 [Phellinidium pouzarii]|uniref:Chitin-binding type-4 domain-containing protein n=1 Tax=Phellinidium pouzarii TaxID=167371 RepID=A0A4S4L5C6_9AGAM|nr:hypothetical protein EW145_g4424 [Phellinidium pouzarii]
MQFRPSTVISLLTLAVAAAAHGNVASPIARGVGSAMTSECGSVVSNMLKYDINTNQQQLEQNSAQVGGGYTDACELFLCKGTQFADNTANVHSFSQGQTVPFTVNIVAVHTGVANVSVVNLKTNSVIGEPLISWTDYASNNHALPLNNTEFSVTIPTDLGSTCSTAGDCALQWWWDARPIDQTYMACVDFTA